ncbi:proton-coupled folate transporter isoform X2 [Ischnura elegans]|uniref:proton-coupled folate transporter isoform X2 n=1 Tax=Ischnura elegans TaxID=197161 RepID=UPI001ED87BC9|nr:proton-coupled folate transporter isoform X2 [Ischnura elegans]
MEETKGRPKNAVRKEMDQRDETAMSYKSRIINAFQRITVEPVMFMYMFAFSVTQVVEQALFVDKACRVDFNISSDICAHLQEKQYEKEMVLVQSLVSEFHQYNNIAANVATVLLALVLGSWSDAVGRKAPLLLGLFGKLYYSLMVVVNAAEWSGGSSWPLYTIIYSATLPSSITGADVAIFLGCFSYLADITTAKDRTWRVAILDAVYLLTMPTGVALGAYLFAAWNRSFSALFSVNAALLLAAIMYTLVRLEWKTAGKGSRREAETVEPDENTIEGSDHPTLLQEAEEEDHTKRNENSTPHEDIRGEKLIPDSQKGCFWKLFDYEHVVDLWKTVIRRRSGKRRAALLTVFLAMALYTFQRDERNMSYLYTQKEFNWDVQTFSNFRTVQSALYVTATLIGLPLLSRKFGVRDTMIATFGAVSSSCARVTFGLVKNPDLFYLGAVFAAFAPVIPSVLRSMTSKLVPPSERGRVFAVLSSADNAVPIVSGVMYSQLYNATLKTFPAAIFFLTLASQLSVLFLVLGIHHCLGGGKLEQATDDAPSD